MKIKEYTVFIYFQLKMFLSAYQYIVCTKYYLYITYIYMFVYCKIYLCEF